MLAYGKYMLYNDAELDLEGRVQAIAEMTKEDCCLALERNFHPEKMAAAAVGKIEKPLSVR